MTIILILTILSSHIFEKVIKFISLQDENIVLKNSEKVIVIISYLIVIYLFSIKYRSNLVFIFYYLTILYLIITAFIDFKIKYVYCILNVFMGINSIIYLIYLLYINVNIVPNIKGILITLIISTIFSKLDVWGWGDSEIFIAIAPIIATGGIIYILINFIIAMALSGLINIIKVFFKGFKIPLRQAFAPYIMFSSLLIMFLK